MTTTAISVDQAVVDMMGGVFAEYRETHPPTAVAERDVQLWHALDDLGLVRLTGAEGSGGSAAGWYEAAELLSAAVRNGVRIPLAEHDLLACWLLDALGMPTGDGAVRTVCLLNERGVAMDVPWVSGADRVVMVWRSDDGHHAADVPTATLDLTPGRNLIGEPRHTVAAGPAARSASAGVPVDPTLVEQLRLKSALVRAIQVCAALDRALDLSIEHATSRIQFGRPLSRFQALQNLIADIAAEAALARSATEAALGVAVASQWSGPNVAFLVAAARSCAGHASSVVVRNAHQVHGAIGTTREHRLHEFTRAALAWRSEFGSVRYWDEWLTDAALSAGSTGLWSLITGDLSAQSG
jgi:acyl-CoA dehydrogenase